MVVILGLLSTLLGTQAALRHERLDPAHVPEPPSASSTSSTSAVTSIPAGLTGRAQLSAEVLRFEASQALVRVSVVAPIGAVEMAITDDPTFSGIAWQHVGPVVELKVASKGYVEIFGRFRAAGDRAFQRAITGLVVEESAETIATGSVLAPVAMVAPDVIAVSIDTGHSVLTGGIRRVVGAPMDGATLDNPANVHVGSTDDPAFTDPAAAVSIVRRSVPTDVASDDQEPRFAMKHSLFVRLARPLREGSHYDVRIAGLPARAFVFATDAMVSPAVQVNQVGFAPSDPLKTAYLSASLAGLAPLDYTDRATFTVRDEQDGHVVFAGSPHRRSLAADGEYGRGDLTGAPVWELDFSSLQTPGRFRVCVAGVGCSFGFGISIDGTWLKLAATVARAAFMQRSGTALGAPYASIERNRIEYPDDGRTVVASGQSLLDNGQGSNDTFKTLIRKASSTTLPGAWGGHMDAGDWDRRIQHLWYLRTGLDLVEMYPDTFTKLDLDIPESGDAIPDVVDEGLWSLDLYMRLQDRDGGIRGGIEAEASPPKTGTSWSSTQRLFAYAADPWSSYLFAGAAAEAAFALREIAPARSAAYLAAATRAADWAGHQRWPEAQKHDIDAQRLVATAALYRATGEARWHELFLRDNPLTAAPVDELECHRHELCDAAWIYLRTNNRARNETVVANARTSFQRTADSVLRGADTALYRFSLDDARVPLVWGLGPSTPKTTALLRAYALFDDRKYWVQAARTAGFSLGANPLGTSFVTGVGQVNPRNPLVVDQRNGGLPVWAGIPVYGVHKQTDPAGITAEAWFPRYFLDPAGTTPNQQATPTLWSWYDLPAFAAENEYTLHQSHAAALFSFGALAALARSAG
jgi:endoglucanase